MPLGPVSTADARYSSPSSVSEFRVLKKLSVLNPAESSGPDMMPSWLSEENADLLAPGSFAAVLEARRYRPYTKTDACI